MATASSHPSSAVHHPSQEGITEEDGITHLPVDINHRILTHISDPASLVRAASCCKLWHNIIMESTFLDDLKMRHHERDFTSSILLGFFFQDNNDSSLSLWQHYTRKLRSLEPSFITTSELLTGHKEGHDAVRLLSLGTFIDGFVASLNFYEPVTSQDSFLVLLHRSQDTDGICKPDVVRVCNPLTGQVFHVPDRRYILPPDCYALFVTDDVSLDGRRSQSFKLVNIWTTGKKFIYSCYGSKTRAWWKPNVYPELMPGLFIQYPGAASNGRIHWLCGDLKKWMLTHVVTLHVDREELSYVELPFQTTKGNSLPGSSADGTIILLLLRDLHMSLWKHKSEPGGDTSNWVLSETIDLANWLPNVQSSATVSLEIFLGKSGAVVLWIEGEGLFLFNIRDRSVRKLDNERVTEKYWLCPYEIDWLSGLATTNLIVDDSSLLDVAWKKIQGRWRTLMAKAKP